MIIETEEVNGSIRIVDRERDLRDMDYYGGRVRVLYIIMAIFMFIMYLYVRSRLVTPTAITVFGVTVLLVTAGFLSPKSKIIAAFNFLVSLTFTFIFVKEALVTYSGLWFDAFFGSNIILALFSLFALYYSSKTLRGILLYKPS